MRFKLPFNNRVHVRLFERVETTDPQYDIVDCGLEYKDGSIDSLVVGGSFATLKGWSSDSDDDTSKDSKGDTPASKD